jgi:hypothetical protein
VRLSSIVPIYGRRVDRIRTLLPVLALLATAALLSAWHGLPSDMPGVSLGWPLLLHIERAAALLATIGGVLLVGARAVGGELPIRLGQIEYAVDGREAQADRALNRLQVRLEVVEMAIGVERVQPRTIQDT